MLAWDNNGGSCLHAAVRIGGRDLPVDHNLPTLSPMPIGSFEPVEPGPPVDLPALARRHSEATRDAELKEPDKP